ncbi:MAG: class I SAM-dependent rRNA methyltransferase [Gammaproteobacteria bacterium]|nr:class I SAM-dependent rRNA methyltransferase [Gammaproteobacteria bacterium]
MSLPTLKLKHGEDRRLRAGHLWVFSNEVDTAATPLSGFEPGSLVQVLDGRGQFVGHGYVNPATLITARIVSRMAAQPVDGRLLVQRLQRARALRERIHPRPYWRWVYGESDGLPGLVLDRFGDVVVGQIATLGMQRLAPLVEQAVREVLDPRVFVWKNDSGARSLEGLEPRFEVRWGEAPAEIEVVETLADGRPLHYAASLAAGQKTGWFYDQVANRAALPRFLARGARVLDVCSYAGAWAVTALGAGAATATCVDSSQAALDHAAANARRNGFEVELRRGDAFEVLAALAAAGARYDAVIVDPPAFIKRRKEFPQGLAAYRKLNQLALRLLERDALLVSCSCSWHLGADDLLGAIQASARHVDRFVQLLQAGGQSPDHPVHPAIPETRYLKAFFCRVTRD